MAANSTDKNLGKKALRPCTEKVSVGRQFEKRSAEWLICRGYEIVSSNIHLKFAELDLLAKDPAGAWVIVEVRYRSSSKFRAIETLSRMKRSRLLRAAHFLSYRFRAPVRVEFLDWVQDEPKLFRLE